MRGKIKNIGVFLLVIVMCATLLPTTALAAKENINGNYKMVAITFDDGPGPYTSRLLDELNKRGAKATFFCTGTNAQRYPELLKRIAAEGHQLANHTQNHKNLAKLSADGVKSEINTTRDMLVAAGGEGTYYIRPPYGNHNATVRENANAPIILWSVDPEDWKYRNAATVSRNIMSTVRDGDIILLHDIHKTSVDAAIDVVDKLIKKGYECVTVSELLRRRGITAENGGVYAAARNKGINLGPMIVEVDGPIVEEHWAYSSAAFMIDNGYFTDITFETFSPDRHITRGMFAAAMSRIAGGDGTYPVGEEFSDVTPETKDASYISHAASIGLINGYGDGTFGVNDLLSKEEAAVMIERLIKHITDETPETGASLVFEDTDKISFWAKDSISLCVAKGIINGDDKGNFNPAERTTRAQAAKMLRFACLDMGIGEEVSYTAVGGADSSYVTVDDRYVTTIGFAGDASISNPLRKTPLQQTSILVSCVDALN